MAEGVPTIVKRGDTIAREGEAADRLYLVIEGLLKLSQLSADGREVIVRLVGSGEPFGGMASVRGAPYPVTAVAAASSRLVAWPRAVLDRLLDRTPQVRANIMREMAAHVTDAITRVRELSTERVAARLAHTLLRLASQCGRATGDGVLIDHVFTRQDLADMTGTTLYTVSRTLSEWEAQGLVQSVRRKLLVRAPDRLQALADSAPLR